MKPIKTSILLLALLSAATAAPCYAGPYSDDMAKCLVRSTTAEDKSLLIQWLFALASLNPDVATMSTVTAAQRTEYNRRFSALATKLMTKSCLEESRNAIKYEGMSAIEASFNTLGQAAGRELLGSSAVAEGMKELQGMFDVKEFSRAFGDLKMK